MNEYLPLIEKVEYAQFRAVGGMAEPPAKLGLPATYAEWLARHDAAVKRFEFHGQAVVVISVSLDEFRRHMGSDIARASLRDLWLCAKKSGGGEEAPKKTDRFSRWGRGEAD